jgi:hypothetical protein
MRTTAMFFRQLARNCAVGSCDWVTFGIDIGRLVARHRKAPSPASGLSLVDIGRLVVGQGPSLSSMGRGIPHGPRDCRDCDGWVDLEPLAFRTPLASRAYVRGEEGRGRLRHDARHDTSNSVPPQDDRPFRCGRASVRRESPAGPRGDTNGTGDPVRCTRRCRLAPGSRDHRGRRRPRARARVRDVARGRGHRPGGSRLGSTASGHTVPLVDASECRCATEAASMTLRQLLDAAWGPGHSNETHDERSALGPLRRPGHVSCTRCPA